MTVLGPDGQFAVEQVKTYVIEIALPDSSKTKQFRKKTTWREARGFITKLQETFPEVTAIRLGVLEGDVIRELWTTGSIPSGTPEDN